MMTNREKYLQELQSMNSLMRQDMSRGDVWKYSNKGKNMEKTFDETRAKKRCCNCVSVPQWGLLRAGVIGSTRKAIQWYGGAGRIVWCNDHAEADAKKYFDIIEVHKNVKTAYKKGLLVPGDILTYDTLTHTNVYMGGGKSLDSGHWNCTTGGELAPFKKSGWICDLAYGDYKINCILRLKLKNVYNYRVRVGIYQQPENAELKQKIMKEEYGYDTFTEEMADGIHVYAGSFGTKAAAEARRAEILALQVPAEIEKA